MKRTLWLLAIVASCAMSIDEDRTNESAILGGVPATDYPEACNFDTSGWECSGVLIAPKLILTAAHCVQFLTIESARCPYLPDSTVASSTLAVVAAGLAHPDYRAFHAYPDVGLVVLADPIALAAYPSIASAPPHEGSAIMRIGRIQLGVPTYEMWKRSGTITRITEADLIVENDPAIEGGDSGGPVFLGATRELVAVNSWMSTAPQIDGYARVDTASVWIAEKIAELGGELPIAIDAGVLDAALIEDALETHEDADLAAPDAADDGGEDDAGGLADAQIADAQIADAAEDPRPAPTCTCTRID